MDTIETIALEKRLPADIEAQPVVQAAKAIRPTLRRYKDEIEREQRMPPALAEEMREAGFYRLLIPRIYGGLESDPLTFLRVGELLAEGCGSVGWNIANNSIGQLVVLGLPQEGTDEIYGEGPKNLAGTAVQGGGKAQRVEGGYRVTGRWQFGSGSNEAVWMLGSFQVIGDDGQPVARADGTGTYWRAVFKRSEVEIVPGTWDVSGLRGTGSFDWTVKDAFLPDRRVMLHAGAPLDNQWHRWPSVTYQLPAQCWVGPHHSSVITGIARAGIDALIELAGGKQPRGRPTGLLCDNPQVQEAVGRADAILNAGRAYRTTMITELWNTIAAGGETTLEQRARCRLAATYAADSARQAMDLMYRAGGSTSFKRESRLAECWRDLHTVGQTVTLAPEWYPLGGKVYLGLDPGSRMK